MNSKTETMTEVLDQYIREDMAELENPMRQDKDNILHGLTYLHRAYWHTSQRVPKQDWAPTK